MAKQSRSIAIAKHEQWRAAKRKGTLHFGRFKVGKRVQTRRKADRKASLETD